MPSSLEPAQLDLLARSESKREFLDLAARHRTSGLVLSRLRTILERPPFSEGALNEWCVLLQDRRRRAAIFELKRDRILALLRRAGIRAVVLKGAAICGTVYDEPAERDLDDLDLLVRTDDVGEAVRLLADDGYAVPDSQSVVDAYEHHHFHLPLRHADGHIVEVHWALHLPGSPFRLEAKEVCRRAVRTAAPGQPPMWIPCPEHLVLHVVLQNLQESFAVLGRLVDIDLIVASTTGFDWQALVETAERGGIASPTALSLQLARRLLGTNVPEGVVRQLLPPPVSRFHLSIMDPEDCLLRQSLRGTYAWSKLFELWLIRGFGQRMGQLCRELGPDELSIICNRDPVGLVGRLVRLGKLGLTQALAYASALARQGTGRRRRRSRFWSGRDEACAGGYLP